MAQRPEAFLPASGFWQKILMSRRSCIAALHFNDNRVTAEGLLAEPNVVAFTAAARCTSMSATATLSSGARQIPLTDLAQDFPGHNIIPGQRVMALSGKKQGLEGTLVAWEPPRWRVKWRSGATSGYLPQNLCKVNMTGDEIDTQQRALRIRRMLLALHGTNNDTLPMCALRPHANLRRRVASYALGRPGFARAVEESVQAAYEFNGFAPETELPVLLSLHVDVIRSCPMRRKPGPRTPRVMLANRRTADQVLPAMSKALRHGPTMVTKYNRGLSKYEGIPLRKALKKAGGFILLVTEDMEEALNAGGYAALQKYCWEQACTGMGAGSWRVLVMPSNAAASALTGAPFGVHAAGWIVGSMDRLVTGFFIRRPRRGRPFVAGGPSGGGCLVARDADEDNNTAAIITTGQAGETKRNPWTVRPPTTAGSQQQQQQHKPSGPTQDDAADVNLYPGLCHLPAAVLEAAAERWTTDALDEHAAVAALSRFTLQLLALGAPPRLLSASSLAAADEVRHATLCFGIAAALTRHASAARDEDGAESNGTSSSSSSSTGHSRVKKLQRKPSKFPFLNGRVNVESRPAIVARQTFEEGCFGETVAAVEMACVAELVVDDSLRAVLREIAGDETRHAALAWNVCAWLCQGDDSGEAAIGTSMADAVDAVVASAGVVDSEDAAASGAVEMQLSHAAAGQLPATLRAAIAHSVASVVVRPWARALVAKERLPPAPDAESLCAALAAALGRLRLGTTTCEAGSDGGGGASADIGAEALEEEPLPLVLSPGDMRLCSDAMATVLASLRRRLLGVM